MATITPTNPPSPPLPQLQSSLCSLATAAHILDGFAHRNKNQHRSTKWWAPFDMLRRTLRKILPDLEAAVQRAEIISSAALGGPPGKRRKTGGGGGGAGAAARGKPAKQPELDRVVERATWTRDVVKTRAYEAFTQLTADRQFAQLGLVLLGVLAQVSAALAPLAREEEPEPEPEPAPVSRPAAQEGDVDVRGEAVPREAVVGGGGGGGGGGSTEELDLGVAVSRDELLPESFRDGDGQDDGLRRSAEYASPPIRGATPARQDGRRDPEKKRTKKRKMQEDVSEDAPPGTDDEAKPRRRQPLSAAPAESTEPRKEKKVKKKRKKGGDEFDDLFSSLL